MVGESGIKCHYSDSSSRTPFILGNQIKLGILSWTSEFGVSVLRGHDTLCLAGGTIIVVQRDAKRIIVAADSRSSNADQSAYWDSAFKINALGNKAFFVAAGKTLVTTLQGEIVFDINRIPARVFNDFIAQPNTAATLHSISLCTAVYLKDLYQDFATQDPTGLQANIHKGNLLQMLIAGTTDAGDLVAYIVKMNVKRSRRTPYPVITSTVDKWDTSRELLVLGSNEKDGFMEFWIGKTERAKIANQNFLSELTRMDEPDTDILRIKAGVQAAIAWAGNHLVGGPIDILELRKGKTICWIQRKPQ